MEFYKKTKMSLFKLNHMVNTWSIRFKKNPGRQLVFIKYKWIKLWSAPCFFFNDQLQVRTLNFLFDTYIVLVERDDTECLCASVLILNSDIQILLFSYNVSRVFSICLSSISCLSDRKDRCLQYVTYKQNKFSYYS